MNILVTGANGQLGRMMRRLALNHDQHHYFYTDIAADETTDALDITDKAAVIAYAKSKEIDLIVNCAAYVAVDKAEEEEAKAERINCLGVMNLAYTRCRIIHVSTDYVFSGDEHEPCREEDKPAPRTAYGRTKLKGENYLLTMLPDSIIIRTAWLYSEFGNNFVKTMIKLGQEKEDLGVVFDQIGTPTYAEDLAAAIFAAIESDEWKPGIYHFTNLGVCSWYDFTVQIHKLYNAQIMLNGFNNKLPQEDVEKDLIKCHVRPIRSSEYAYKTPRPPYSVLDKTKIVKTFGIDIPYWTDSLARCIQQLGDIPS